MATTPKTAHRATTSARRSRWRVLVLLPLIFACALGTLFAFLPPSEDTPIPPAQQGGGARQVARAVSGLDAPFPEEPIIAVSQAELGRLLFYDPVLSGDNERACASCHHPDLGFADGRALSPATGGGTFRRHTPSLWNVAFVPHLFWDGRADSLEAQMIEPLTKMDEMGADLDALLQELRAIPEYRARFAAAYGTDAADPNVITLDGVTTAIAAFERTLISTNAPFDRFAAGDTDALTPSERRGFDIFRSAQTRCIECHALPNFTHNTFHILGVPDLSLNNPDLGRGEVVDAPDAGGAFRTPGLRNIALTAPYMHTGQFTTLEEVIDFYATGGGSPFGIIPDEKIRGFGLSLQQVDDLVAFLGALTDEPADLIAIPARVPSGLPVVAPIDNPARVADAVTGAPAEVSAFVSTDGAAPAARTIRVETTIQAAVDLAQPGDTVLIPIGVYHETVYIDRPNITVRGEIDASLPPETGRAWLDGENTLSDGFNTSGNGITLEGVGIRNYIGNGVLTVGARGVVYRDLIIENTGLYGVYPVECTDVLIEGLTVTGIRDAAIYVGQSRAPIIVRDNVVHGNVTGIEIENSTNADVYNNHVYDNTGGILVFLLPNNPSRVAYGTRVYANVIENNNRPNFGDPNSVVGLVPPGTGVLILSADDTEVFNNVIRGNQTGGVGISSLYMLFGRDTVFDLGVIPEYNWIHDNTYENNGYDPQGIAAELGIPGTDVIWTGEGWTNRFDEPDASMFPPILPSRAWADPAARGLWRLYDVVIGLVL
ncbi:MAG: parallel beta-helix domain-containing protein [Chloroflexota bacterium]|nr:parallel beta-helix domain-containing protein [Chloroflexota bacterium]